MFSQTIRNTNYAILIALIATTSLAKDTHLFILSGQSNMSRMKEAEGFLPEVSSLLPGDEILLVKVASPGKPIRNWLAEWDQLAIDKGLDAAAIRATDKKKGTPYFDALMEQVPPMMAMKPDSVTFVWMQGESDSKNGAEVVYEEALTRLISKLRDDFNAPEMNVVIGRISDYGSKNPKGTEWLGWKTIRAAQQNVVTADPRAAMVSTDDVNGPKNGLHYPAEGYELTGRRMARQAVALVKGETPAVNGMPE
jgi:hypothetical protein